MIITAKIDNSSNRNDIVVATNSISKQLSVPAKADGKGSSINGGEMLFTAIATCFCNDIYREAGRRNIIVNSITVMVTGEFGNEGEPAKHINYSVELDAETTASEKKKLIEDVDRIAEIHNTLRQGISVVLAH